MFTQCCRIGLMTVLFLALATPVVASTFVITDDELDPEIFPAVAESIRTHLNQIPKSKLSGASRELVLRSLDRMERFMADDPRRHDDRIRQDQRRVNSALLPAVARDRTGAEVVCRRVKDVGSHIHKTQCRSRQEIEAERQASMKLLTRPGIQCGLGHCRLGPVPEVDRQGQYPKPALRRGHCRWAGGSAQQPVTMS